LYLPETLSRNENIALLKKAKKGDKKAYNQCITSNLRLVTHTLKKMGITSGNARFDDCFQSGCEGLIRAVKLYNPDVNVEFSTFAATWIKGAILGLLRKDNPFSFDTGNNHNAREVIEKSAGNTVIDKSGKEKSIFDLIKDPVENENKWIIALDVELALSLLNEDELLIITNKYLYGLSQLKIGCQFGQTQSCIAQKEKRALKKMRAVMTGKCSKKALKYIV